jgi:hypothetical protein
VRLCEKCRCSARDQFELFRESVKKDSKLPVIMGRGMIACKTPALQEWWDGKRHHK